MKRSTATGIVCFSLACLLGAATLQPRLMKMRSAYSPHIGSLPENTPPLVVFTTVAMGGLTGLAVDLLWARITMLQEDGKYIEIVPLANMITRLEPKLTEVWDYHSFNMAYNISIMFSVPEDRWLWVSNGLRMLRDEALMYNPQDVSMYDRLCRLYLHKLIETTDPARNYYRFAWANEMTELFGNTQPDFQAELTDSAMSRRMRNDYKLDPKVMLAIDRRYGPFDWRMPHPHVIYWATRAHEHANGRLLAPMDGLLCEALADAVLDGRLVALRPVEQTLITAPRFDLLPKVLQTFDEMLALYSPSPDKTSGFRDMYLSFLQKAIVSLYKHGEKAEAMKLYDLVREKLRDPGSDRSLEEYIEYIPTLPQPQDQRQKQKDEMLRGHF